MGSYIYRVTAKKVKLSNGGEANVAAYAYKPFGGWDRAKADANNNKMHFRTSCSRADSAAAKGKFTGLVVGEDKPGSPVWEFKGGSFTDDWLFGKPPVEGVVVA